MSIDASNALVYRLRVPLL